MVRGHAASIGDTRVSANGYHYTKCPTGWKLTHQLVLEEKLGRPLEENERCRFKDFDRTNLDPDNLEVYIAAKQSMAKRRAWLEAKIEELQAELDALNEESD